MKFTHLLALCFLLLAGCSAKYFHGNETIALITRSDFHPAAAANPELLAYCVATINRLEYEMHGAKEAKERDSQKRRRCAACAARARASTVKELEHSSSPPLPPIK